MVEGFETGDRRIWRRVYKWDVVATRTREDDDDRTMKGSVDLIELGTSKSPKW
jgi:hypothetical protein